METRIKPTTEVQRLDSAEKNIETIAEILDQLTELTDSHNREIAKLKEKFRDTCSEYEEYRDKTRERINFILDLERANAQAFTDLWDHITELEMKVLENEIGDGTDHKRKRPRKEKSKGRKKGA